MKKIIIVNNNLHIGGVQKSLINFLKEIHTKYDVTLLLFHADEENADSVPAGVKVITVKSPFKYFGISLKQSRSSIFSFGKRMFWAAITRTLGRSVAISLMLPFQKKINGYDCAISYLQEGPQTSFYGGCNEFVLKRIDAPKKITWLHCDYRLCGANEEKNKKIYKGFDTIVACSEGAKTVFIECLPELKDKCVAVRNCNDYTLIKTKSKPGIKFDADCFNVVTVSRLSEEKGIDRMLYAVFAAKKEGYKIRYHIVGDGPEQSFLKDLATELNLTENVIFHGSQQNPYPYIASADLFALSSLHEAAPMVFDEAMCLGVPILATKTTSTDEMILKKEAGFVCENSQEGITQALLNVLSEPQKLSAIADSLKQRNFTNKESIDAIRKILE